MSQFSPREVYSPNYGEICRTRHLVDAFEQCGCHCTSGSLADSIPTLLAPADSLSRSTWHIKRESIVSSLKPLASDRGLVHRFHRLAQISEERGDTCYPPSLASHLDDSPQEPQECLRAAQMSGGLKTSVLRGGCASDPWGATQEQTLGNCRSRSSARRGCPPARPVWNPFRVRLPRGVLTQGARPVVATMGYGVPPRWGEERWLTTDGSLPSVAATSRCENSASSALLRFHSGLIDTSRGPK